MKLDDRLRSLARTTSPDLWPDIQSRVSGAPSGYPRRALRAAGIAVAAMLLAAGIILPLRALLPLGDKDKPGRGAGEQPVTVGGPPIDQLGVLLKEAESADSDLTAEVGRVVSGNQTPDQSDAAKIAMDQKRLDFLLHQAEGVENAGALALGEDALRQAGLVPMTNPEGACSDEVWGEQHRAYCLDTLDFSQLQVWELVQRVRGERPAAADFLVTLYARPWAGRPPLSPAANLNLKFVTAEQATAAGCRNFAEGSDGSNGSGFCIDGVARNPAEVTALSNILAYKGMSPLDVGIVELMAERYRQEHLIGIFTSDISDRLAVLEAAWMQSHTTPIASPTVSATTDASAGPMRLTCEADGLKVNTQDVTAGPNGVTFDVANPAGSDMIGWFPVDSNGTWGADVRDRNKVTWDSMPPGRYAVGCGPESMNNVKDLVGTTAVVSVIDPQGYWHSQDLQCGDAGSTSSATAVTRDQAFADRSASDRYVTADVAGMSSEEIIRTLVTGVQNSDVVDYSDYPMKSHPAPVLFRVLRDGTVVAHVAIPSLPTGGGEPFLQITACNDSGIHGAGH